MRGLFYLVVVTLCLWGGAVLAISSVKSSMPVQVERLQRYIP